MVSERMRLRLERLLDEADAAADRHDWKALLRLANDALLIKRPMRTRKRSLSGPNAARHPSGAMIRKAENLQLQHHPLICG